MNNLERSRTVNENWQKFHVPGTTQTIKRNAVFINKHNNIKHEIKKLEVCYGLAHYITEAARGDRVHDVVDLITGQIYEVIYKHESDEQIKEHRGQGIIPVFVEETITCEICKRTYPRRNKTNICGNCKKEVKNVN